MTIGEPYWLTKWREGQQINVLDQIMKNKQTWSSLIFSRCSPDIALRNEAHVTSMSFNKSGNTLYSGWTDGNASVMLVQQLGHTFGESVQIPIPTGQLGNLNNIAHLGNDKTIVSDMSGKMAVFDNDSLTRMPPVEMGKHQLATSPRNGEILYAGCEDSTVRMFDFRDKRLSRGSVMCRFYQEEPIHSIAVAKERSEILAICGEQPFAWVLDARNFSSLYPSAQLLPSESDPFAQKSVTLNDFGSSLIFSWSDHGYLFDVQTSYNDFKMELKDFGPFKNIPELEQPVSVESPKVGKTKLPLETIPFASQETLSFGCNVGGNGFHFIGETLATCSSSDGMVLVWDLQMGAVVFKGFVFENDNCIFVIPRPDRPEIVAAGSLEEFVLFQPGTRRI